ncbi:MAG: Transcriptional regulator [Candidatus Midichloria mitochondrii]|uniref:Uncharacterized protein n=1 Tax=Midichloria mitochondrii (strain IricVA) TaxID=696127 RepID=F7XX01_MIDMI|nr:hypothetical protein midi_00916 [Candidatus Midichloria mitochondrii IricVA]
MKNAYTSFPRIACKFFSPARTPLQLGVKDQDIDLSQEFHLFPAAEEYIEYEHLLLKIDRLKSQIAKL